ncbi:hypothetical protein GJ496_002144 [Pomphorhynchus laevis]|nr:hypothetical protein GJ496_002144 [Pomphorhynchus laevis]
MSVTVNNKESVTNRYWQEQQLSFLCGEVDRNYSHLSLCVKNQVEANRSFSLQNQQTNLMKNRVNLKRKPNSTYFASRKEESDKSKVRYKPNPRKTESLNDKHSLRYDRAPKEPIKPFTKMKRRHTFSTAVELVTSGAKLSGKWWIAKVNSFKVNAEDMISNEIGFGV